LALLNESDGALDIQDLLELAPDFSSVGPFREPVCAALRAHAQEVEGIQREMAEVQRMTQELRADLLQRANSRY
jgi:hypothetical protein